MHYRVKHQKLLEIWFFKSFQRADARGPYHFKAGVFHILCMSMADLGGGGLGGINPPCLFQTKKGTIPDVHERIRRDNISRPTQYVPIAHCLQAQPQTIGFKPPPPPPLGCPVESCDVIMDPIIMVSIALVDARKTSLKLRFKIAKKIRYFATYWSTIALADYRKTSLTGVQNRQKKSACRFEISWTMVSIALVDATKTYHLRGFKIAKKSARRFAARGRWSPLR